MRKHTSHFTCQNGFTLTEVMVTVAIIGILAVAAVGNYIAMKPTRNMRAYGRDLLSEIHA